MTNETEKQPKKKPAFYIFTQDAGNSEYIGAAFRRKTGTGFNILIGNDSYVAFEPKLKSATTEECA
jgi:hypothetical protein